MTEWSRRVPRVILEDEMPAGIAKTTSQPIAKTTPRKWFDQPARDLSRQRARSDISSRTAQGETVGEKPPPGYVHDSDRFLRPTRRSLPAPQIPAGQALGRRTPTVLLLKTVQSAQLVAAGLP